MFQKRFTRMDAVIFSLLLCVTLLGFLLPLLRNTADVLLIVTPDGEQSFSLTTDQTITLSGNQITLTVEISNGKARVCQSNCPDGICRSSGWIAKDGQSILCAPAGIRLTVKGGGNSVDFIAG